MVSAPAGGAAMAEEGALCVKFLHLTDHETWSKATLLVQAVALDCESGTCSGAKELIPRVQEARSSSNTLRGLTWAIEKVKAAGICEEQELCGKVFGFLAKLATGLPELFPDGIPMLVQHKSDQVTLTRRQCAALHAASVFNLLPSTRHQCQRASRQMDLPSFDLGHVMDKEPHKMLCLVAYFVQVAHAGEAYLNERVSFQRRCQNVSLDWARLDEPLCAASVREGCIEDSEGNLQADFANEYLGGGALQGGNVQEEIRFAACPECYVGMLFCECMLENEAIFIVGTQQYSRYSGYGDEFRFATPRMVERERPGQLDRHGRWGPTITAFDALQHPGIGQFSASLINRELLKAYVACLGDFEDNSRGMGFATGNWGCGVFGGEPQLKSLVQWVAASAAKRPEMLYFPFGDARVDQLEEVIEALKGKTCAQVYVLLMGRTPGAAFKEILAKAKI